MSMLTAQVENLRIMARLVRDYDYREISRELREAADAIENLRNRLTETCRNVGLAPYFFECSACGKTHLRNAAYVDMPNYCPNCGRRVVE